MEKAEEEEEEERVTLRMRDHNFLPVALAWSQFTSVSSHARTPFVHTLYACMCYTYNILLQYHDKFALKLYEQFAGGTYTYHSVFAPQIPTLLFFYCFSIVCIQWSGSCLITKVRELSALCQIAHWWPFFNHYCLVKWVENRLCSLLWWGSMGEIAANSSIEHWW